MFADIGIGIVLALSIPSIFGVSFSYFFIILGICFCLLPDIDMLVFVHPFFQKLFTYHREITHYPVVYVPIFLGIWYFLGPFWSVFFFVAVLMHLIHDTLWIGTGVRWLWPFSTKSFIFFSQDYKIKSGDHWVKAYYLHATIVSVVEYSIFIGALLSLLTIKLTH